MVGDPYRITNELTRLGFVSTGVSFVNYQRVVVLEYSAGANVWPWLASIGNVYIMRDDHPNVPRRFKTPEAAARFALGLPRK